MTQNEILITAYKNVIKQDEKQYDKCVKKIQQLTEKKEAARKVSVITYKGEEYTTFDDIQVAYGYGEFSFETKLKLEEMLHKKQNDLEFDDEISIQQEELNCWKRHIISCEDMIKFYEKQAKR